VRRLKHPVAGRGDDAAELVDGVGGSECEADVAKPRQLLVAGRSFAAARQLEQLQADAAEIQHAAANTGVGVYGRWRGHRPEQPVEVAQALDIIRRQRDVLDLGDRRTECATAHGTPCGPRSERAGDSGAIPMLCELA
jgi:hypothetical protein